MHTELTVMKMCWRMKEKVRSERYQLQKKTTKIFREMFEYMLTISEEIVNKSVKRKGGTKWQKENAALTLEYSQLRV